LEPEALSFACRPSESQGTYVAPVSHMPAAQTRALFEALARRAHEPRLSDVVGIWEFHVEHAGTWTVTVDHGALRVSSDADPRPPTGSRSPTTRLRLSEDEFVRLARGDRHENLFTGVIRGAIVVEGDVAFAQRLQTILPLQDEQSART
jgi:hypothetical protein